MPSLKEIMARSEAAKQAALAAELAKKKQADQLPPTRTILHGSGFTRRLAEQQAKEIERQALREVQKAGVVVAEQTKIVQDAATRLEDSTAISPVTPLQLPSTRPDFQWDESQLAALDGLTDQKFGCLIGAAGTGKTTLERELIKRLEQQVRVIRVGSTRKDTSDMDADLRDATLPAIAFCAFTGRATQMMKRALDPSYHPFCSTIHALLGYYPEYFEKFDADLGAYKTSVRFVPYFTAFNKLPFDVVIVDEAGMVPVELWNRLIEACHSHTRIFLVGDINQLPPVMGQSVLGFAMTKWPSFELTKIHRQAADNPIIANAHRILSGQHPMPVKKQFDMVQEQGGGIATKKMLLGAIQLMHRRGEFDPMRDTIIVPTNVNDLGQELLNEQLVLYFNPHREVDGVVVNRRHVITTGFGHRAYAVGDKVMLTQNDRDRGLTNGMIGTVVSLIQNGQFREGISGHHFVDEEAKNSEISLDNFDDAFNGGDADDTNEDLDTKDDDKNQRQASHIMTVRFENGEEVAFGTAGQYRNIMHAYAVTCHKSQGGEYHTVVILCHSAASARMMNREWLYTAVTRARERVVIIYNNQGLKLALGNQRIKGKTLAEKAKKFLELQGKATELPHLPEPEVVSKQAAE